MQSLILGTAQWGSHYGVTNRVGRLDDDVIRDAVATAKKRGITAVDTAPAYGDAEERIAAWAGDFSVTTKVVGGGRLDVIEQLTRSLTRLGRSRVERCLVHDWASLTHGQQAATVLALQEAQRQGLVGAVGISAYGEDDLRSARGYEALTVAQLPVNVLDQRLEGSPTVAHLRESGWTIQARSILLQGLLAGPSEGAVGRHPALDAVARVAQSRGLTMADVAVAYVAARRWIDEIVVGVTSAGELDQICESLSAAGGRDDVLWAELSCRDLDLIDPRRW